MNNQHKGDYSELRVAGALMRLGWQVSFPYMEEGQYDLVAEKDGEFIRVQVKSSVYRDGGINFSCYNSQSAKGSGSATHYTSDDIEGIAVYNHTTSQCYWVPIDAANKWKMRLNEEEGSKNPASEYILEEQFP